MKNKKTIILTALDFSRCSANALDYALQSYKDYDAKIVIIHAIQKGYTETNIEKLIDKDPKVTKMNIDKKLETLFLNKMKKHKAKCDYELITEFGTPLEVILKAIKRLKPFFVIIGAKKTTNFVQTLFRNDTIMLIEQAKCPLVVLPEGVKYKKIKKITFATNYHASDIMSINNIVEQAKPFNIEIVVLHISDRELTGEFEQIMLMDFKKKVSKTTSYKNITYKLVEGDHIETVINKYLKHKNTDLFAMSTTLHEGWLSNLLENRVSKILQQSKVPVMAYHYKGEKDNLYVN